MDTFNQLADGKEVTSLLMQAFVGLAALAIAFLTVRIRTWLNSQIHTNDVGLLAAGASRRRRPPRGRTRSPAAWSSSGGG